MAWNWAYEVGPTGSTMTPLSDYCTYVRIAREVSAAPRSDAFDIPHRPGVWTDPDTIEGGNEIFIDAQIRFTNSTGGSTHADGGAGHAFDNLDQVRELFYGDGTQVILQRTAPHHGTVQADVKLTGEVQAIPGGRFIVPLVMTWPYWRQSTSNTDTGSTGTFTINVGGNAPVYDATVVFYTTGTLAISTGQGVIGSGDSITVSTSTTAVPSGGFTYNVKTGDAYYTTSTGTKVDAQIESNRSWGFRLPGNTTGLSLSWTGSTSGPDLTWYSQWR